MVHGFGFELQLLAVRQSQPKFHKNLIWFYEILLFLLSSTNPLLKRTQSSYWTHCRTASSIFLGLIPLSSSPSFCINFQHFYPHNMAPNEENIEAVRHAACLRVSVQQMVDRYEARDGIVTWIATSSESDLASSIVESDITPRAPRNLRNMLTSIFCCFRGSGCKD